MIVYGICDHKSKAIQIIFPSINDETAIRTFEHTMFAPEDSIFNCSPEDFSLYRLAVIEFESSPLISPDPELLRSGNEYSRDYIVEKRRQALVERRRILSNDTE